MSVTKRVLFFLGLFILAFVYNSNANACFFRGGQQDDLDFKKGVVVDASLYDSTPVSGVVKSFSMANGYHYEMDTDSSTGACGTGDVFIYKPIDVDLFGVFKLNVQLTDSSGAELPGTFTGDKYEKIYIKANLIKERNESWAVVSGILISKIPPTGSGVTFNSSPEGPLKCTNCYNPVLFYYGSQILNITSFIEKPKANCALTSTPQIVDLGVLSTAEIINDAVASKSFHLNMVCTGGDASITSVTARDVSSGNETDFTGGVLSAVDTSTKTVDPDIGFKYDLTSNSSVKSSTDFPMDYNVTVKKNTDNNLKAHAISGGMTFTVEYN